LAIQGRESPRARCRWIRRTTACGTAGGRAAEPDASRPLDRQRFSGSLGDPLPFQLAEHAHHLRHRSTHDRRGVDTEIHPDERPAVPLEASQDLGEVADARETRGSAGRTAHEAIVKVNLLPRDECLASAPV
jgi:hypothetical protein